MYGGGVSLAVSPTLGESTATPLAFEPQCAGEWFVLHVKPRQEKCVADTLDAMGTGYYLPVVKQVRYYGRRRVVIENPLFPGYLFLRGSIDDAYDADRTKRVVQVIRVVDQEHIDWELQNLYLAMSRNALLQPFPYLKMGMRVEVRSGPFRGLQGIVAGTAGSSRLLLQVRTLNQAVSLEIDGSLLDVVS